LIKPLELTEEKFRKAFDEQMSAEWLHVSDEARVPGFVGPSLVRVFSEGPHEVFELGEDGLLIFKDIVPGFKCAMSFILWNHESKSVQLFRETRKWIEEIAREYRLVKVETQTADERVVRMAKLLGFELEGYRPDSFWRGPMKYGVTLLGRCFDREEE
jgi:hypothetical protein